MTGAQNKPSDSPSQENTNNSGPLKTLSLLSLTSSLVVLADPDVVWGTEVWDVRDGALTVDLPDTLELVLQVRTALGTQINCVHIKDGPTCEELITCVIE